MKTILLEIQELVELKRLSYEELERLLKKYGEAVTRKTKMKCIDISRTNSENEHEYFSTPVEIEEEIRSITLDSLEIK